MLSSWTKFEKYWLLVFSFLILGSTFIFSFQGTDYRNPHSVLLNWLISPISAITGIVCVILVAKGKISNYLWGTINCITYGYVAYYAGYYGDMILNVFYMLPFQFIGWYTWSKNLKSQSKEDVVMLTMKPPHLVLTVLGGVLATILIGLGLFNVDHWFINHMKRNVSIYNYIDQVTGIKFLGSLGDASTEVLQIIAQILMTLRYAEQWVLWIAVNVITIGMWSTVLIAEPSSASWVVPTIIMWVAYLVNSVYGLIEWYKGAKNV